MNKAVLLSQCRPLERALLRDSSICIKTLLKLPQQKIRLGLLIAALIKFDLFLPAPRTSSLCRTTDGDDVVAHSLVPGSPGRLLPPPGFPSPRTRNSSDCLAGPSSSEAWLPANSLCRCRERLTPDVLPADVIAVADAADGERPRRTKD